MQQNFNAYFDVGLPMAVTDSQSLKFLEINLSMWHIIKEEFPEFKTKNDFLKNATLPYISQNAFYQDTRNQLSKAIELEQKIYQSNQQQVLFSPIFIILRNGNLFGGNRLRTYIFDKYNKKIVASLTIIYPTKPHIIDSYTLYKQYFKNEKDAYKALMKNSTVYEELFSIPPTKAELDLLSEMMYTILQKATSFKLHKAPTTITVQIKSLKSKIKNGNLNALLKYIHTTHVNTLYSPLTRNKNIIG